jgi:hypothetical protein
VSHHRHGVEQPGTHLPARGPVNVMPPHAQALTEMKILIFQGSLDCGKFARSATR